MRDAAPTRQTTVGLVALQAVVAFEVMAVAAAMPAVVTDLGGLRAYALAFAAPLASSVVGMTAGGGLGDRFGPRAPLLAGLVAFLAGVATCGVAPGMTVFVVGRLVQGLGSGALGVAMYVLVGAAYAAERHARVLGLLAAAWVLPAMAGPALAGLLVATAGWRPLFLVVPLLAVVAGIPLVRASPAVTGTRRPVPFPWPLVRGAAAAGVAVVVLHLLSEAAGHGSALAGLAALPALVVLAGTARPLLPAGTLRGMRGLPAVVAIRGCASATAACAETFLPLLLNHERHLPVGVAGAVLTGSAIGWATASWAYGRLSGRVSPSATAATGFCLLLLAVAGLLVSTTPGVPVAGFFCAWAVGGAGMGLVYPASGVAVLAASDAGDRGGKGSSLQVSDGLAAAAALAVGGVLLGAFPAHDLWTYRTGFACAAGIALTGLVLAPRAVVQRADVITPGSPSRGRLPAP